VSSSDDTVRLLLVDDHALFRFCIGAWLSSVENMTVVGEAADVAGAIAAVDEHRPDIVVMDLGLGECSGVDAIRQICSRHPDIGILVLTMFEEDKLFIDSVKAGARGFLLKDTGPAAMERALHAVANGEILIDQRIAPLAARLLTGRYAQERAFPELTDREYEVLELMAEGLDNGMIARQLACSDKTIRHHSMHIRTKLGIETRSQLIVHARNAGLGHPH